MGVTYPSIAAFCTAFGLLPSVVAYRIKLGITGERLTVRKLRPFQDNRAG